MSISEAHAGRSYPVSVPYQVSRAKIAEFAGALGDSNPAYSGTTPIAPPTFGIVLAAAAWRAMFDDPELGIEYSRTVHAEQRFTWQRLLRAGDEVVATLTIEKVRRRGPAAFITIAVQVSTVEGEDVCTAISTLVHTDEAA
jgi:acyl dehydratase